MPALIPFVKYDLVKGHQVRNSEAGQIIIRMAKVQGIPVFVGMSDATVLTRCYPFLPGLYSNHPDTVNFPNATLREINLVSVPDVHQAIVELVYRAPGPNDFVMEDVSQTEFRETYATAGGSAALVLWYKKGTASTIMTAPAGSDSVAGSTHRLVPKRIMRVKGWSTRSIWNTVKDGIRQALGQINKVQWGLNITDERGHWLFAGISTITNDYNRTYHHELFFINEPTGHYEVRAYLNIHGEHPPDSATEAQLRALGPPAVGGSITLNGIGMFSIYNEIDFNPLFGFTPI